MAARRTIDIPSDEQPKAHIAYRPTKVIKPPPEDYRLGLHHQQTLRDVCRGAEESRAGIRTRYIPQGFSPRKGKSLTDLLFGNFHLNDDEDVELNDLERYVASTGDFRSSEWRREVKRSHETFERLRTNGSISLAAILSIVYGYPDPTIRTWPLDVSRYFGELASLAKYTDAVEHHRRHLARQRAVRQHRLDPVHDIAHTLEIERHELNALSSGDALHDLLDLNPEQRPIRIEPEEEKRYRQRAIDRLTSRLERIDQQRQQAMSRTTSTIVLAKYDAMEDQARIEHALTPANAPRVIRESDAAYLSRLQAWEHRRREAKNQRATFMVEARAEASRMLAKASRMYWESWIIVGPTKMR